MTFRSVWDNFLGRFLPNRNAKETGGITRADILLEMNRIAGETGARIPGQRQFRKKLIPPFGHAMKHIAGLMDQVPGPVNLDPENWDDEPLLKALFLDVRELKGVLRSAKAVQRLLDATDASEIFAVLTAGWKEKSVTGTEETDGIVRRDVLQRAIYFEGYDLTAAAVDLQETRRLWMHRRMVELVTECIGHFSDLRSWKEELEGQRDLLEFQMHASSGTGRRNGPAGGNGGEAPSPEAAEVFEAIDRKLSEIASDMDTPEDYFNHLAGVLTTPEQHLRINRVSLKTSRMGLLLAAPPDEPEPVAVLPEFEQSGGRRWTAVWVKIGRIKI